MFIATILAMFTEAQIKAGYTRIMNLLLQAHWLRSYSFTDGKGYHLTWDPLGTERSFLLKRIAVTYRLQNDDRAAVIFDKIARGETLPDYARSIPLDNALARFWCECVDDLGLRGDADGLLFLVHIVMGWAPDLDTPVKFDLPE